MERTQVVSNIGQIGGGGVLAVFFNSGPEEDPLLMTFVDSKLREQLSSSRSWPLCVY